ncbi:MAG: hypothetical protein AAF441_27715 [Pseudomonadota bacterium]
MKRPTTSLFTAAAFAALFASSANAADLGLNVETLLKGLTENAQTAGAPLKVKKVGCRENKKPGDATKKIMSCSHLVGAGKVLITNADPSGPLLDVSTQRWKAGADGPAVQMMSWLAGTLTGTPAAGHTATANKAVETAITNRTSATTIGDYTFTLLDFGNSIMINVSRS